MSTAERLLVDPTEGLELITGDEIALEAPRHIFLAADLLDPARKRDIGLKYGGEELDNPCLRRTRGLLPRCEITPLEFWGKMMPLELFPEGQRPYKLKGAEVQGIPTPRGIVSGVAGPGAEGQPHFISENFFMPVFPGELIVDAIGIASGERRGIVEVRVLKGVDYGGIDRELQRLFFPESFGQPVPLRLIREQIDRVAGSVADSDAQSAAEDFLISCEDSGAYMAARIGTETTQVLQRVHPQGHVYTYSRMARSFATQLEVRLNEVTDLVNQQITKVQGVDAAQLAQLNQETLLQIGDMFTKALTAALGTQAKPVELATEPVEPEIPVAASTPKPKGK